MGATTGLPNHLRQNQKLHAQSYIDVATFDRQYIWALLNKSNYWRATPFPMIEQLPSPKISALTGFYVLLLPKPHH